MTIHLIGDELVGNTAVANDDAAPAQGMSIFLPGADFVVNTTTARDQAQPSIAGLDDGHFVVTWLSDQGGPQYDVHGQVFNQDGSIASGEFIVSSPTANSASGPSTAGLGDGLFVVTWYSKVGDSAHTDILGRVFNVDGTPAGEEFIVNTTTDGPQHEPSVASLGDGRFVVTWASPDDDLGIIVRGRLFNADGSGGGDFPVHPNDAHSQSQSSVTGLGEGRFVVTWAGHGVADNIGGQIFNADGSALGDAFIVNSATVNPRGQPSVGGLVNGGFIVAWTSGEGSGPDFDIQARMFNADGSANGPDFIVNTTRANYQAEPHVVSLGDGSFLITWISDEDASGFDIRGQVFNADGSPVGTDFILNTTTANDQYQLSAAAFDDGRIGVTWISNEGESSGFDIRGTILSLQQDNSAPIITFRGGGDTATILLDENSTGLGVVTAIDADAGQTLAYVVTGTDAEFFTIHPHTGTLAFIAAPDFEAPSDAGGDNVYNITVQVSDGYGDADTQAIAVNVMDVSGITLSSNAATLIGTAEEDQLSGQIGANTLLGLGGNDVLSGGNGDDVLDGGSGNDNLRGGNGDDTLIGGDGNDVLSGGNGVDLLRGGDGDDILNGGTRRDTLEGGHGDDRMTGGVDSDKFVFKLGFGHDTITDFKVTGAAHDILEFDSNLFANTDALFARSADVAGGVLVIVDAADTLTIKHASLAQLQAHPEDFHFV